MVQYSLLIIVSKHNDYRNRVDFLFGHYMVSRAENKRIATLPDLGVVDCPQSENAAQEQKAIILIMNQGSL